MARYIRKAERIDAIQWFPGSNIEGITEIPPTFGISVTAGNITPIHVGSCSGSIVPIGVILIAGQLHQLLPGDWLVTREDSDEGATVVVMTNGQFQQLYEPLL